MSSVWKSVFHDAQLNVCCDELVEPLWMPGDASRSSTERRLPLWRTPERAAGKTFIDQRRRRMLGAAAGVFRRSRLVCVQQKSQNAVIS